MKNKIVCFILALAPITALSSGTVVRNGGDPIFYFLEATRFSLVETLRIFQTDVTSQSKFCEVDSLNPDQKIYCRSYFAAIYHQLFALNQRLQKTLFVLREQPLIVEGPDGKPMPVAARTAVGPDGEIEFHRDSVKLMSPAQILFLMAHEFQHKVRFDGGFVTDNHRFGPFQTGRELIDSVAAALVRLAQLKGKVGTQYSLRDSYSCQIQVKAQQFGIRASSARQFLSEDLLTYGSSLSKNPGDFLLYVPESQKSELHFRVEIHEPRNCSPEGRYAATRGTHLQIVRVFKQDLSGNQQQEQIVSETTIGSYNPICMEGGGTFSLSYQDVNFNCQFYGTEGTTQ